jgi:hypothetical protein
MDEKTKATIRSEVEEFLKDPPTSFTQRIEAEVERRVEQRLKNYRVLARVITAALVVIVFVGWDASLDRITRTVENQLAEQEVVKAAKRILEIRVAVESAATNTSESLALVKANETAFLNRLAGIKGEDNVVLGDDLSKIFVRQVVTNLDEGNRIRLDHEPIPHTVSLRFSTNVVQFESGRFGTLEGKAIVLNSLGLRAYERFITNNTVSVDYIRKSLREGL